MTAKQAANDVLKVSGVVATCGRSVGMPLKELKEPTMGEAQQQALDELAQAVAALSPAVQQPSAAPSGVTWEENVEALLARCPHTIRSREGGGPEDLIASLVLTFTVMQQLLASAQPPSTQPVQQEPCRQALADISSRFDPVYVALKDEDCIGAALALERVLSWCSGSRPN